jgi:hypothetical protein
MELDLTEAIEAGTRAMWSFTFSPHPYDDSGSPEDQWCENTARAVLSAAAPILERQVREKIAQEADILREFADEDGLPEADVLMLAAIRFSGQPPRTKERWRHIYTAIRTSAAMDKNAAIARGSSPSSSTEEKGQR